jgi:UDP-glucose 4-epimerase
MGGSIKFMQGDILDRSSLMNAFAGMDEVYLLAGKLGTSELDNSLRLAIEVNILGALEVFEAALACNVPRVLFASKPSRWLNTYTITKYTAEKIAHLISRYHPIQISVLSYLNIFGPGQKLYPVRKILPVFAAQAIKGLPIQVYGDGQQTVDMIFSKDAALITIEVMRNKFNPQTIECGTGTEMSVLEVARSVNEYFGNQAGIQFMTMRKGETLGTRLVANTDLLQKTIGQIKLTPFKQALAESLEYYKNLSEHEIDATLDFYGISQPFDMSWS